MAHRPSHLRRHQYAGPDQYVASQPDRGVYDMLTWSTATIFGHKIPVPIMFAPIGINKLYSPLGELIPARVAGELGMPVGRVVLMS